MDRGCYTAKVFFIVSIHFFINVNKDDETTHNNTTVKTKLMKNILKIDNIFRIMLRVTDYEGLS